MFFSWDLALSCQNKPEIRAGKGWRAQRLVQLLQTCSESFTL